MRAAGLAFLLLAAACASAWADRDGSAADPPLQWPSVMEDSEPGTAQVLGRGLASWYGLRFHGRRTASGERFDMNALTAAHPFLPFGTLVKVRSLRTGRSVTVRITDRGPHVRGRIIDLSHAAARAIGLLGLGTRLVVLTPVAEDE